MRSNHGTLKRRPRAKTQINTGGMPKGCDKSITKQLIQQVGTTPPREDAANWPKYNGPMMIQEEAQVPSTFQHSENFVAISEISSPLFKPPTDYPYI